MAEITIKDLMDAIHYTIIQKRGDNSLFINEVIKFEKLIDDKELENYTVNDNEQWSTIVKKVKEKPDIPHTYY